MRLNEIKPNELFFIDIGGYDGVTKSNTFLLENFGCKGIIVEPNINLLVALKMNRKAFIRNLAVILDFDSHEHYLTYEKGNALGARLIDKSSVDSLSPLLIVNFIHVSELISTCRSLIDKYSFVYLSIDIERRDAQILENFLAIGFIPDFISIEHNHNVSTKAIVKKLAFQYGYKLVFHNFFRNEYMLVKQI